MLIAYGIEDGPRLAASLVDQVWRPLLEDLEGGSAVRFDTVDWECDPLCDGQRFASNRGACIVSNARHPFAEKVAAAFFPANHADRLRGPDLMVAIGIAVDYPSAYSNDVEVEYMYGDGPVRGGDGEKDGCATQTARLQGGRGA